MHGDTLVIGESLIDVVRTAAGVVTPHPGGSPLNVAVGLARLGRTARLATWIADDAFGSLILRHLDANKVALVEGSKGALRTPSATATLNEFGSATYHFDLDWQLPYSLPTDVGHLHTGSIGAALQPGASAVREALFDARGRSTISLDPNVRPSLMGRPEDVRADIEQLIGLADVVKASDEDIEWLYGVGAPIAQVLRLWSRLGPAIVVATRGALGATVYVARGDELFDVPGRSVSVVDTVGAGDSFMAALLAGLFDQELLGGLDARARLAAAGVAQARQAVDLAIEAAAITVSRPGANPPTRAELVSAG